MKKCVFMFILLVLTIILAVWSNAKSDAPGVNEYSLLETKASAEASIASQEGNGMENMNERQTNLTNK